jgi:hypothetical protein
MIAISKLDLVHREVKIQRSFGCALVSARNTPERFLNSQSLPDLRRRAYALCSADDTWENLAYVVLVKRYAVRRVYVEIWKRIVSDAGRDAPTFSNDQRAPEVLGVTETMEFVANAHAFDARVERTDRLDWQFDLPGSCDIPACDDLLVGGAAVTFNAQIFLDKCEYNDPEVLQYQPWALGL